MNDNLRDDPRYQDHRQRPDLAGEHPVGDTLQNIAFLIFAGAIILDYFVFGFPQKFNHMISIWLRLPFSLVLFASGGKLAQKGIRIVFEEYRPDPIMITDGLFAYVRHPIYLGVILIYVAVLLLALSPLGALVWLGVLGLYQWLAKHEERLMVGLFGDAYREYQKRVPMWLPLKWRM